MIRGLRVLLIAFLLSALGLTPAVADPTSAWLPMEYSSSSTVGVPAGTAHALLWNVDGLDTVLKDNDQDWQLVEGVYNVQPADYFVEVFAGVTSSLYGELNTSAPLLSMVTVTVVTIDAPFAAGGFLHNGGGNWITGVSNGLQRTGPNTVSTFAQFTWNSTTYPYDTSWDVTNLYQVTVSGITASYDQAEDKTSWKHRKVSYARNGVRTDRYFVRDEKDSDDVSGLNHWGPLVGGSQWKPQLYKTNNSWPSIYATGDAYPSPLTYGASSLAVYSQMADDYDLLSAWIDGSPNMVHAGESAETSHSVAATLSPDPADPDPDYEGEYEDPFDPDDYSAPTTETPGFDDLTEDYGWRAQWVADKMTFLTDPLSRFLWPLKELDRWKAGVE